MAQAGIAVLSRGLPPLPDLLTYQMVIPVSYWTASRCAVVLFLQFDERSDHIVPLGAMATYTRPHQQGPWEAVPGPQVGIGVHHDPIARPGDLKELDGQAMATSGGSQDDDPVPGYPAAILVGRAAPAVRQIALVQDGHEDRRPLHSHFGFWVVCTEKPTPFRVTVLSQDGTVLDTA